MEEINQMMKTAEETLEDLLGSDSDRSLVEDTNTTTSPNRDFGMKKEEYAATTPATTATADLSMISTESLSIPPAVTDDTQQQQPPLPPPATPMRMVTDDDHQHDTVMMTDDDEKEQELVGAVTPNKHSNRNKNSNLASPPKPVRKAEFQTFNPPAEAAAFVTPTLRKENPLAVFRKAVEKNKLKQSSSQPQRSSYRDRRRELTVPLDLPIASRMTASWSGKTGGTNTSTLPSFPYKLRKPSIVSPPPPNMNRKRKLTVPLDVPLAKRPTLSWLGRQGKDDTVICQRNERNMNRSRNVHGNYLPSIVSRPSFGVMANSSSSVFSNMVFPPQKHYHKHTIPEVVMIANKPTASWDNREDGYYNVPPESSHDECLPYMKTPNGQLFIRGGK